MISERMSKLLNPVDMIRERSPRELLEWRDYIYTKIAENAELRKEARVSSGLIKKLHEEIRPLSILAEKLYRDREDVKVTPIFDNDNYDAIITDYSKTPAVTWKVEFTYAIDGLDNHLRMEILNEEGLVPVFGDICKSKGKSTASHGIKELDEILNINFDLILNAAKKKTNKVYGQKHILGIFFDDYIGFDSEEAQSKLKRFFEDQILRLPLDFKKIYLMGSLNNIFMED
jgi:hypothetical protein